MNRTNWAYTSLCRFQINVMPQNDKLDKLEELSNDTWDWNGTRYLNIKLKKSNQNFFFSNFIRDKFVIIKIVLFFFLLKCVSIVVYQVVCEK